MSISNIRIVEKPDWVTWESVRQCLIDAHVMNRAKGIHMAHYLWSAEKIKESLGEKGKMFVALDGESAVGTAAISFKFGNFWYVHGEYAYMGFAGVLPAYKGHGIYKELIRLREEYARQKQCDILLFDTHSQNKHVQEIAKSNGYRLVRFFRAKSGDHYSVVLVKWINGCPFSSFYCWMRYQISKLKVLICYRLRNEKQS